MRTFLRKLHWAPRRRRHEADIREELEFHLEEEAAEATSAGLSERDARRSALRDLGNLTLLEEDVRAVWRWAWLERLAQDARYAVRTLLRDPSFTAVAVVTLSLGLAATICMFAVTKSVLLNSLPFPEASRLVMVWEHSPQGNSRNLVSAFNFAAWRARTQSFESLGAITPAPLNITGLGDAEQLPGLAVTPEFFTALAIPPIIGRTFEEGTDRPGGPRVAVISYRFWQQRFGGAPDVVGRQLSINGVTNEIIGVMPKGFAFPASREVDLYIPLRVNPTVRLTGRNLTTVARLKPGVSLDSASADMRRVTAQLAEEEPVIDAGYEATVAMLFEETVGPVRRTLWVIFAAVACLLLLTCANVANLLLIRAARRTSEISVRIALGAARWKVAHQLAVENITVATVASVIGLVVARIALPLIPRLFDQSFPLPRAGELAIDWQIVSIAFAAAVVIGVCFSVLPVVSVPERHLVEFLHLGTQSIVSSNSRLRRALVVLEVAIALVLVFAAGLVGRSLAELSRVQPGFQTDRVLTVSMLLLPSKYSTLPRRVAFLKTVLDNVRAIPGVTASGAIHFLPLAGLGSNTTVFRSDRPTPPLSQQGGATVSVITSGYLSTMGIRLNGRDFAETDRIDTPRVTIVNESLARRLFPDERPIGKLLTVGWSAPNQQFEIVGIASDVLTSTLDHEPEPALYIAQTQEPSSFASLAVRTAGQPAAMMPLVRAAIARADPDQGISAMETIETVIRRALMRPRAEAVLFGTIALLALLIAGVGVYGVMSYNVEQRRREMGLRLALGAAPNAIVRSILAESLRLAGMGTIAGMLIAFVASQSLSTMLYKIGPHDPVVFVSVAVTLLAVAAASALKPARGAVAVDPVVILRGE